MCNLPAPRIYLFCADNDIVDDAENGTPCRKIELGRDPEVVGGD